MEEYLSALHYKVKVYFSFLRINHLGASLHSPQIIAVALYQVVLPGCYGRDIASVIYVDVDQIRSV